MASKPSSKLSAIPIPHGYSADEADFYRRGFVDARACRGCADLHGYPLNLRLAYVSGGLDGA